MTVANLPLSLSAKRSWETRYRWHSVGIAAKQAALVWACAAKRWWLGEEMHGVQGQEEDQRGPGERLSERTVKLVNWTKEDAMDRCKWRKMIKDVRWSGWVWVGECFFWYWPTRVVSDKRLLNGCVQKKLKMIFGEYGKSLMSCFFGSVCIKCSHLAEYRAFKIQWIWMI